MSTHHYEAVFRWSSELPDDPTEWGIEPGGDVAASHLEWLRGDGEDRSYLYDELLAKNTTDLQLTVREVPTPAPAVTPPEEVQ